MAVTFDAHLEIGTGLKLLRSQLDLSVTISSGEIAPRSSESFLVVGFYLRYLSDSRWDLPNVREAHWPG